MLDSNLASYASVMWNSKSLGGQLTSFFNVGSILMAFFAGKVVDIRGRKNSLMIFCLLFAVPTVAMVLIPLPGVALGVRLIQGIAKGVVVAMASVVSDVTPREKMNGGYNLGNTISMAIGPMLGLMLVEVGGYPLMFVACAVTYGAGAAFAAFMNYEKNRKPQQEEAKQEQPAVSSGEYRGVWALIEKKAILPSLINTIFFGGYACILVYLTIYAQEALLLSAAQISLFYTVAAATMLVIRLTTATVADKYGAMVMIAPRPHHYDRRHDPAGLSGKGLLCSLSGSGCLLWRGHGGCDSCPECRGCCGLACRPGRSGQCLLLLPDGLWHSDCLQLLRQADGCLRLRGGRL